MTFEQIGTHVISADENLSRNSDRALGTLSQFKVMSQGKQRMYLAWTVNISPNAKVPQTKTLASGKKKVERIKWSRLTPREQHEFFDSVYIRSVVYPMCHGYIGHYEQCQSGMLHLHLLCVVITDFPEYDLASIRATVNRTTLVTQLTKRERYVALNHIVICDRLSEWMEYLMKEQSKHPLAGSYKVMLV